MMTRARTYLALMLIGLPLALPAKAGFLEFFPEFSPEAAPILRYPGGQAYESFHVQDARDSQDLKRAKLEAQRRQEQSEQQSVKSNRFNIKKYQDIAKVEGVKAALLKDHTLRPGDILVTAEGLIVYEGVKGGRFQPLQQSSLRNRPDLQKVAITLPGE